jgi:hypothetical protein
MSPRQDRPSFASRALLLVGVASLGVVGIAARMPGASGAPQQVAGQDSVVTPVTPSKPLAPENRVMVADSATVVMMQDAALAATVVAPAPAPASMAPAAWPVDPVTGQTLINGIPVVGRVFIQRKVDGLVKIANVAAALAPEAMAPEAPIVKSSFTKPAPQQHRRIRTIMVQSTLWSMDHKRSATRLRHLGPSTSGASLGQR